MSKRDREREEEELLTQSLMDFIEAESDVWESWFDDKKTRRKFEATVDYDQTKWGKLYMSESTRNPSSREGKLFRRRFRLPFPVFNEVIVPLCIQHDIFGRGKNSRIPVYIKAMAALRILGRNACCDDIAEAAEIGESTANTIFRQFIDGMCKHVFASVVKPPMGDGLQAVVDTYAKLGLPGCVGSMDCTHVRWIKCPKYHKVECTGKEGFPTLSFQVVVDHSRRVMYCSEYFFGKCNDITVANNDPFCKAVRMGKFRDLSYEIIDSNGIIRRCRYRRRYYYHHY